MRFILIAILSLIMVCCAEPPKPEDVAKSFHEPQASANFQVAVAPAGVPQGLYNTALAYYQANLKKIPNQRYLTIVDFKVWSGKSRMWIIDMQTNNVQALHVAHGAGSDPKNSGYATSFSNVSGSYKSSLGFYLTAETYQGNHGTALKIDGLSSTNSNVRSRVIVIHGAKYVWDQDAQIGRSLGCFAIPMEHRDQVIAQIKNGSLLFAGVSN